MIDCRAMLEMLASGAPLSAAARQHISSCAQCRALVDATAIPAEPISPEMEARLGAIAAENLTPVRPLSRSLHALLFFVCAVAAAAAGDWIFGVRGWRESSIAQKLWLIPGLAAFAVVLPAMLSRLMIPGTLLRLRPEILLACGVGWFGLAAPVVYSPRMYQGFGPSAAVCMSIGLGFAAMVGMAAWVILRRGFVTAPGVAALTAGGLAGVSSLGMQFVYCHHLDTGHYAIAHFGALVVSILIGRNFAPSRLRLGNNSGREP